MSACDFGLIAAFGILHGFNEWIDLHILIRGTDLPAALYAARAVILAASFLCLVTYGVRNVSRPYGPAGPAVLMLPVFLLLAWAALTLTSERPFLASDIWSRYLLGLPGAVLTFVALSSHARDLGQEPLRKRRLYIRAAAWGFLSYGLLAGLVVPEAAFFPASVINYESFSGVTGLPVQVFRTFCAVCIALTMVKALGIFDWEGREALRAARDDLELKVRERTHSLMRTNEELEHEIAERSRVQRDVQRAKEEWELTFDSARDAIMLLTDDYRVRRVNRAMAGLLGREPEEAAGHHCYEVLHNTEEPIADCPHMCMLRDGEVHDMEYFEDNLGRHFSVSVSPVLSANGLVTGSVHIMRDITERKRVETALDESRRRFRELVEYSDAVHWEMDLGSMTFSYMSPKAETMLGYPSSMWTTFDFWVEHIHQDDREWVPARCRDSLADRKGFEMTYRLMASDGRTVWVRNVMSVLEEEGIPRRLQGVMMNVTQTREAEEGLRSALKEKEILLREVHHRVKNNMQVISSLLRLQASQVADEATRALFKESQDRITSMAIIHEELYRSPDMSTVDMRAYVKNLGRTLCDTYGVRPDRVALKHQVEDVSIAIDTAIPCGLILNELISNALKHAFPDGRRGEVNVSLHGDGEGAIVLDVSDNGVGLPPGFDIHESESMGLRLVTMLAEMQLEGRVTVEGQGGARFKVVFQEPHTE
jgi:PAS domain S-box-containing protein